MSGSLKVCWFCFRYPFALSKSSMYSIGAPHTWPQALGALIWLIDTVKVTHIPIELLQVNIYGYFQYTKIKTVHCLFTLLSYWKCMTCVCIIVKNVGNIGFSWLPLYRHKIPYTLLKLSSVFCWRKIHTQALNDVRVNIWWQRLYTQ